MGYTESVMKRKTELTVLIVTFLSLTLATAGAEYSPWSFFGGLNLIYNSDGEGVTTIPGMREGGLPGGLTSAPSLLPPFFGVEYRWHIPYNFGRTDPLPLFLAPSASLYGVKYLWGNDRPLPAELENRTSSVFSLLVDVPAVYAIEQNRMTWSFGAGLSILARYGFLESGVSSDEKITGEDLDAGEQVKAINKYFWNSGRWLYPTVQAGVKYRLETGWGAGVNFRLGVPIFNLWSTPSVPFYDSMMYMLALVITPPTRISRDLFTDPEYQEELPSLYDPAGSSDPAGTNEPAAAEPATTGTATTVATP
jgi:hypothetical protein